MATLKIHQKDYGANLAWILTDSAGTADDLTGYTVQFVVWERGSPDSPVLEGSCSIVSAVAGTITYTMASGDFDTAKSYRAKFVKIKTGVRLSYGVMDLVIEESA